MPRIAVLSGLIVGAWAASARAQIAPPAPETLAVGDWQLAPLLEARVRGEYSRDLDDQDRGFLLERARVGVDAQRGAIEGRVVLQDARLWSIAAGTDPVRGRVPLAVTGAYEAWGEAHTLSPRPAFVRIGRQPVTWGEGRLLGVADWSPTGRSLDAVRARLSIGQGAAEVLAASLSDTPSGGLLAYGELFGARGQWAFHPLFSVEGYVLARLAQANPPPGTDASVRGQTYTSALHLHGDAYQWSWGAEGAIQLGRAEDLGCVPQAQILCRPGLDRMAWAAAAHVAHTFDRVYLLPIVRLGISYASGDKDGATYRAFDPLLPDVHVWHGAMDLFSWSNEEEASARLAVTLWTDSTAAVEYRYARLAEPTGIWRTAYLVPLGAGAVSTNTEQDLGHEIDAVLTASPWVPVELTAGYSVLVLGNGARAILAGAPSAPPSASQFAYLQAVLRLP